MLRDHQRFGVIFNDFMADNYDALMGNGYSARDIEQLPINELMDHMKEWVINNK